MNELNERLTSLFPKGPLLSASSISTIGDSLIIAPHPDDESLACGGTIALLTERHYAVHVIFITDGTMSHPNSELFPPLQLRNLREAEAVNALQILGVLPHSISFLRLADSKLNELSPLNYEKASETIKDAIKRIRPKTILVPWRKDPHPDHEASWHLLQSALKKLSSVGYQGPTVLEYLLWFWERTNPVELESSQTTRIWTIDIASSLTKKARAIQEHKSQLGKLIQDDPEGFSLPSSLLEQMHVSKEIYLEFDDLSKKDKRSKYKPNTSQR